MSATFLNVQEAADFLGVSKSCAYAAIESGEFPVPVIKVGSRIKVPAGPLYALAGDERAAAAQHRDAGTSSAGNGSVVGSPRGDFEKKAAS